MPKIGGGVCSMLIVYSVLAFLLSCGLCPLIIKFCNKKKIFDEIDERKIHTGNIPRFGGIAVFVAFILFVVLYDFYTPYFNCMEYWQVILAFFIIFITGILDDYFSLDAKIKFCLQIASALIIALSPFYFRNFLDLNLPFEMGRFAIFFWIILCVNAYNLIDGIDWLCSGLSLISVLTFAICGFVKNWSYYPMLFLLAASIAGFMVWNKPNAKIFLGDGGSTSLGFIIAVIPVLNPLDTTYDYNQVLICLLISSIPTIDVVAAIIRRIRDKKGIFSPDKAHLHHKLLNIGFTKTTILICILTIQTFIGAMIVFSMYTGRRVGTAFISAAYFVVICLFIFVHYVNRYFNQLQKGCLQDCNLKKQNEDKN